MRKNMIYNLFLIWTIVSGSVLSAQTVKGVVSDNSGPLPQVNISVKGTQINTVTDFDGNYSINNVEANAILVFSYIGYVTKEVPFQGNSTVNVVLVEDSQKLGEVIVVGYTSQKKASITGAISTVDMGDLSKTRIADVAQALQGQIA
jgi:hypothetical protein